jgi:hypothetical protein
MDFSGESLGGILGVLDGFLDSRDDAFGFLDKDFSCWGEKNLSIIPLKKLHAQFFL